MTYYRCSRCLALDEDHRFEPCPGARFEPTNRGTWRRFRRWWSRPRLSWSDFFWFTLAFFLADDIMDRL